jgi:hypothetical protein
MSLSPPPNQSQPPPVQQPASPLTLKQRVAREAFHWADLSWLRFALLIAPILPLIYLDPLLPPVAYALWLWASSSWAWRDRWASIRALAQRGGMFVGLVLLYATLSNAQVWILPQLTATLQNAWNAHVPGDLSLSPFAGRFSLVARLLLLLPLAPALALYFERVDPRTRVQQQRILTARDLEPKKPRAKQNTSSSPQKAPPQEQGAYVKPKPTTKAAPRERAKQQSESPPPQPEQITIDSYLAPHKDQAQASHAPRRQTAKKQKAETPAPAPSKQIDWNDVAE